VSRGFWALSKDEQRDVREWRRVRDLSDRADPRHPGWPLWLALLVAFAVGYLSRRFL
jgi:hypothetical protein